MLACVLQAASSLPGAAKITHNKDRTRSVDEHGLAPKWRTSYKGALSADSILSNAPGARTGETGDRNTGWRHAVKASKAKAGLRFVQTFMRLWTGLSERPA